MESKQANFGSCGWIHSEIQRRGSELAQSNSAVLGGEDLHIVVSREIFEELLKRSAQMGHAGAADRQNCRRASESCGGAHTMG
jgi:hypothetical protein